MSTQAAPSPRNDIIKLNTVRLSYPQLFKAKCFGSVPQPNEKPKFSAVFLLDKKAHAKEIADINKAIQFVLLEKYGPKAPKGHKLCLRDGSEKPDTDGYGEDMMFISASNEARPQVVDRDRTPLAEEDGKIFAGCYVNAVLRLWVQDNNFGKRVNASLRIVQYVKKGEPFGEAAVDVESEIDVLPEETETLI